MFNIHTAVLGNSGSGKSNTITHILHEVYRKTENHANGAKTIIFDANGEYPIAFGDNSGHSAKIDKICYKPNIEDNNENGMVPLYLPYYLMNLDEWLSFLMASERTQKPFWDKVLQECFKFYKIFNSEDDATEELSKEMNGEDELQLKIRRHVYEDWSIFYILRLVENNFDSISFHCFRLYYILDKMTYSKLREITKGLLRKD